MLTQEHIHRLCPSALEQVSPEELAAAIKIGTQRAAADGMEADAYAAAHATLHLCTAASIPVPPSVLAACVGVRNDESARAHENVRVLSRDLNVVRKEKARADEELAEMRTSRAALQRELDAERAAHVATKDALHDALVGLKSEIDPGP